MDDLYTVVVWHDIAGWAEDWDYEDPAEFAEPLAVLWADAYPRDIVMLVPIED